MPPPASDVRRSAPAEVSGASPSRELSRVEAIRLRASDFAAIVGHGRRKLERRYREDETPEQQAFGLVCGRFVDAAIETTGVFPLFRNMRYDKRHGRVVDETVRELAIPSKTPTSRRGWLADPREVIAVHERCDAAGTIVFGSYHMHKVGWEHDPLRDTPTALDTALAEGQGIWMLVLSLVDPANPILRAFYEGRKDREAPIVVVEGGDA